jgi:tetratricopeptide (TPR) repeat protein
MIHNGKLHEAGKVSDELLALSRTVNANNAEQFVGALNTVAEALDPIGNADKARTVKAEPLLWRALEIAKLHFGNHDVRTAQQTNLFALNLSVQGRDNDALPYYESAIRILNSQRFPDRREIARITSQYGGALERLGRTDEATLAHARAAELIRLAETEGVHLWQDRFKTLFGDGNTVSLTVREFEAVKESVRTNLLLLKGVDKQFGEASEQSAKVRLDLSRLYLQLSLNCDDRRSMEQCARDAETHANNALQLLQLKLGPDHPDVAQAHYQLAMVQQWTQNDREAKDNFEKAYEICKKHPDKIKNGDALRIASRLVLASMRVGDPINMEWALKEVLELCKQSPLTSDHGDFSVALHQVARSLMYVRSNQPVPNYSEVQQLLELALSRSNQTFGRDSVNSAQIDVSLANCFAKQGKNDQALPLFERSIMILENQSPVGRSRLANVYDDYAAILRRMGRIADAERAELQAWRFRL